MSVLTLRIKGCSGPSRSQRRPPVFLHFGLCLCLCMQIWLCLSMMDGRLAVGAVRPRPPPLCMGSRHLACVPFDDGWPSRSWCSPAPAPSAVHGLPAPCMCICGAHSPASRAPSRREFQRLEARDHSLPGRTLGCGRQAYDRSWVLRRESHARVVTVSGEGGGGGGQNRRLCD